MKKTVCFILIVAFMLSFSTFAAENRTEGTEVSNETQQGTEHYIGYYISGCGYSSGVSRVSYYVTYATITVSGPTGTLMVVPVSGIGCFDFPTQANQTYSASAPGYESSTWVAW